MKLIRLLTTCTALGISMCAVSRPQPSPAQPFDIVITKGHIIDGTGSPWYSGDIGIRMGRIAAIGNLSAEPRKRRQNERGVARQGAVGTRISPRQKGISLVLASSHRSQIQSVRRILC